MSYRLTGDVDVARLHDAVNAVARRHSVLRTTYQADADGEPQLTVHDDLTPGWSEHDLSELSDHARGLRLEVLAQREFATPFDLSADAPLRITVVRTGSHEYVMLLVAHHIAWDDGSWRVFFTDLTRAYAGDELSPATPSDASLVRHRDRGSGVLAIRARGSAGAAGTSGTERVDGADELAIAAHHAAAVR